MNRLYFGQQRDPFDFRSGQAVASSCYSEPFDFAQDKLRREWSEWDEQHGRLRSVGSCERIGRRTSQISSCFPE